MNALPSWEFLPSTVPVRTSCRGVSETDDLIPGKAMAGSRSLGIAARGEGLLSVDVTTGGATPGLSLVVYSCDGLNPDTHSVMNARSAQAVISQTRKPTVRQPPDRTGRSGLISGERTRLHWRYCFWDCVTRRFAYLSD